MIGTLILLGIVLILYIITHTLPIIIKAIKALLPIIAQVLKVSIPITGVILIIGATIAIGIAFPPLGFIMLGVLLIKISDFF